MRMWRCLNCKREYEAVKPACAACELDPAANPRDASLFAELFPHHFDPPTKVAGRGKNHAACDARLRVGATGHAFTGDPAAVTCKACKASAEFAASGGKANGVLDIPLTPS